MTAMRGVVGSIKWSYYTAAAINGYTVTKTGATFALHGTVVMSDAFKLAQRPLLFVAPLVWQGQTIEWRWPIVDLSIREGAVTATLGPPVEQPHG